MPGGSPSRLRQAEAASRTVRRCAASFWCGRVTAATSSACGWSSRATSGARRSKLGDLKAEAKVYERYSREALQLDSYFAGLAKRWRGWKGDKEWEALGLRLAARHDGLGARHARRDA